MEVNEIAIILGITITIIVTAIFIGLPFRAIRLIRSGGQAITEAAQELDNKRLEEAGGMINRGAGILMMLLNISLVFTILSLIYWVYVFIYGPI